MSMKVCMIGYTNYISDGRLNRYAQSLLERGDTVHAVGLGDKRQPNCLWVDGVLVHAIHNRQFNERTPFTYFKNLARFFFLSVCHLTRLHFIHRYDVIHYHNIPDFGIFCAIIPKLMGAKVILDIHDVVPEFYMRKFGVSENSIINRLLLWIEKISCIFSHHVITVTDIWHKRLRERSVPADKCSVIMNLPYAGVFKRRSKITKTSKDFLLSYHGNLNETTGVDIAIRAVAITKKEIPSIHLQIIGEGRDTELLKKLVRDLNVHENISFYPPVSIPEVPKIIGRADAGLDPKHDGIYAGETLSVKVMEYLGIGLPAIVSKTVAADQYFKDGCVLFFKPGDEKDLARCIIKVYRDPKLLKSLSEKSNQFNRKYNWEQNKKVYFKILDSLVQSKTK